MANITATAGTSPVSFTLTSGLKITFPASSTNTQFVSESDLADLQRSGLLDAEVAAGNLSSVAIRSNDAAILSNTAGSYNEHILLKRQVITATGTYTPTPGANRALVRMVGGGGGGGGIANSSSAQAAVAGGGAGGAYFEKFIDPGTYPLVGGTATVGAAGAGGLNTGAAGSAGGDTSIVIGGTTYTAKGGPGGAFQASIATAACALGGGFATGSTAGDFSPSQDPGAPGVAILAAVGFSGAGGSSPFGAGGNGLAASGAGNAGQGKGAGGGGALSLNAGGAAAGGAGTIGVLVIDEYS
jgi:hypothetical protein